MVKAKRPNAIRDVIVTLEKTQALRDKLQEAYPDLRKVPLARREHIKRARAHLDATIIELRLIIDDEADARLDGDH